MGKGKSKTPQPAPGPLRDVGPQRIQALLQQAVALHQRGQLTQAQAVYQEVLRLQPANFDALHLLGVIALQTKDLPRAIELIGQAIAIQPNAPVAHSNLGNAWGASGQPERALACYDRAVALKSDYTDAHYNRSVSLLALKRWDEAAQACSRVLALQPRHPQALYNQGNAYLGLRRWEDALSSYDQAIAVLPGFADAHCNRGNALDQLQRPQEALLSYERAIGCLPNYAQAHMNRGNVLVKLQRHEEAIAAYNRALALQNDYADAYAGRGHAMFELKRFDEALADYQRAIQIDPDNAVALAHIGNLQRERGALDEAMVSFNRALALDPQLAEGYVCRGNVWMDLGRTDEVMADYAKAIELQPNYADAHWNQALCLLRMGDFARGWEQYEWRWKRENFTSPRRDFSQPQWTGEQDVRGLTVLLHAEQGLGDTLQFCRYAPLVAERGARVVLEVQPALHALLRDLPGVAQLCVRHQALPDFDLHCPLLSLPFAFKTDMNSIPARGPYLHAREPQIQQWGERLGSFAARRRIGMVWSGSTTHKNDRNRSLSFERLLKAMPADAQLVSLQKEVRPADLEVLRARGEVLHFGEQLQDFSDTAALVQHMDLVISVDTSVAHLAGAMGKPTWVLLPFMPDWRWLLGRSDSPWYPGMRLFRQVAPARWDEPLDELKAALAQP